MKNEKRYIAVITILILVINTISFYSDKELLQDLYYMDENDMLFLDKIEVNEVFSNSFGFISNVKIKKLSSKNRYMIEKQDSFQKIYFKVNTIKNKDSLYFFQHIDWITKKNRKIEPGNYHLYEIKDK